MNTGAKSGQKKIWITGGSGFLGSTLIALLRERYDIVFSYHRQKLDTRLARGFALNLNEPAEIAEFLDAEKPSAVVHCAAMTDVDFCEKHFDEALKINAEASGLLAQECARRNIYLIYISTEAVYGDTPGPHLEDEPTAPVNRYAVTKLKGEEAVTLAGGKRLIARTGFEGWGLAESAKLSFFEWLIRKFDSGQTFQVFEDRIFTPFSVNNFAEVIDEMIAKEIEGLYNVEGPDAVSYLAFARQTAKIFGFNPELAVPARMADVLKNTARPHDTALDSGRIRKKLNARLLGPQEILEQLKHFRESGQLAAIRFEWSGRQKK